jgi:hypothetical protein
MIGNKPFFIKQEITQVDDALLDNKVKVIQIPQVQLSGIGTEENQVATWLNNNGLVIDEIQSATIIEVI